MENKELEKNTLVELEDGELENVSGGAVGRVIPKGNGGTDDSDYIKDETMIIIPII